MGDGIGIEGWGGEGAEDELRGCRCCCWVDRREGGGGSRRGRRAKENSLR